MEIVKDFFIKVKAGDLFKDEIDDLLYWNY